MMGAFAAGKTSLASRFVRSVFSEKYFTTVGVKIDKHIVRVDSRDLALILWDLHGEDEFQRVRKSYLRGSSGILLVVDGTRRQTLQTAVSMYDDNRDVIGGLPFVVVLNKSDLRDQWELPTQALEDIKSRGWELIETSAKTGTGVEDAFLNLARQMLKAQRIGIS
jgi:small GTP-binding protein